jgi:spore coat protein JC
MVGAMVHQLMKGATIEQIKQAGAESWYTDHDRATWPGTGTGVPFTAAYIMSKGDPIADIYEDMAAEEKARATYEHLIDLADDPDVIDPLRWLRQREVVHFQRFGEILNKIYEWKDSKKYY